EGIRHLDGRIEVFMPLGEEIGQVLPRVSVTGEEKGDLPFPGNGEHPRRESALSFSLVDVSQYLHRRIIVMDYFALRRLPDQFLERGMGGRRGFLHDVPLGGCGKGDTESILELLEPAEGNARPIFQEGYHGPCGRVVLVLPRLIGSRGEHLPAEVAPELLAFKS